MAEFFVPRIGEPFSEHYVLIKFLHSLEQLFEEMQQEELSFLLEGGEIRELFRMAYFPVPAAIKAMTNRLEFPTPAIQRRLYDHALYGPSLVFKLTLIQSQNERFNEARLAQRQAAGLPKHPRGLFKKLLERIDILLESLVEALAIGGLVVEFKKGAEALVPDDFGQIG